MTQAIITKYHGPTSTRGSRITAKAWGGSLTVSYDHSKAAAQAHALAAEALASKLAWRGTWAAGSPPDDTGYCFVQTASPDATFAL